MNPLGNSHKPKIINNEQGSQFTSGSFADCVLGHQIKLSMDCKGRAIDNALIERIWRSVKYKKVYLNPPTDGLHLYELLNEYFRYYNLER
jgi:putative transposase